MKVLAIGDDCEMRLRGRAGGGQRLGDAGGRARPVVAALPDLFLRRHAPALVVTLAASTVSLAAINHFSARRAALSLHGWLINIMLPITAPVTPTVPARAALLRRRKRPAVPSSRRRSS